MLTCVLLLLLVGQTEEAIPSKVPRADKWKQQLDVVYGYKDGMALVMDVITFTENRNEPGVATPLEVPSHVRRHSHPAGD